MDDKFCETYFDFDNTQTEEKRKYIVVIIYDIVDNKRRYKLSKYLKMYGFRVQRSSFEGILEAKNYKKLIKDIDKYIDEKEDLVRIYRLAGNAEVLTWGNIGETKIDEVIIV